jgi:hypothetical protein
VESDADNYMTHGGIVQTDLSLSGSLEAVNGKLCNALGVIVLVLDEICDADECISV